MNFSLRWCLGETKIVKIQLTLFSLFATVRECGARYVIRSSDLYISNIQLGLSHCTVGTNCVYCVLDR